MVARAGARDDQLARVELLPLSGHELSRAGLLPASLALVDVGAIDALTPEQAAALTPAQVAAIEVEVDGLDTDFVAARVLVELPIGNRDALLVPSVGFMPREVARLT